MSRHYAGWEQMTEESLAAYLARPQVALTARRTPPSEPYVAMLDRPKTIKRSQQPQARDSKTESRFERDVLEVQMATGEARHWWYHPLTLRIFPPTERDDGKYTPDFVVQRNVGSPFPFREDMPLTLHPAMVEETGVFLAYDLDVYEVKMEGHRWRKQNDLDRIRMCPQLYPSLRFHLALWSPKRREWLYTHYKR